MARWTIEGLGPSSPRGRGAQAVGLSWLQWLWGGHGPKVCVGESRSVLYKAAVPFPLIAHQAPVVLLRAVASRRVCVVALTLGSVGPDLEYLARAEPRAPSVLHASVGAFGLTLPLLLLSLVVRYFAGPALLMHLGQPVSAQHVGPRTVLRAFLSVVLGVASHLALDRVVRDTHWSVAQRLEGFTRTPAAFELVLTGLLSVVTLAGLLHALLRARNTWVTPKLPACGAFALVGLLGATIALARCLFVLREPTLYFHAAKLYAAGYALFHASAGASMALLALGTCLALVRRRARMPRTP